MLVSNIARRLLIYLFKRVPFILCFITLLSHLETLYAMLCSKYILYDGYMIFDTPISFFVARYFQLNIAIVLTNLIISFAIESCFWNKVSLLYLASVIAQKILIEPIELELEHIVVVLVINIIISALLVYKGIRKIK